MITEDMMRINEMVLMTYLFDTSDWLLGKKTINHEQAQMTKDELLKLLKDDFSFLLTDNLVEYVLELSTTIGTLEELSEDDFQKMKLDILSWETKSKS